MSVVLQKNEKGARWAPFCGTSPSLSPLPATLASCCPAVASGDGGAVVVEVYSNSSSAPNSASRTFLRSPSESASATPAPTMPSSRTRPKPPLALLLRGLAQGHGRVADRLGRLLEVLLQLLVVEELLRGRLAVAQPAERVAAGLVGLHDVRAQILVVDDLLHVRVVPRSARPPSGPWRPSSSLKPYHPLSLSSSGPWVEHTQDQRPSSAASKTSEISPTQTNSMPSRRFSGKSSRSGSLRRGASTRLTPGALGGERLLLQAADREHQPGQRELAGHRRVVAHAALGDQRHQRRRHRDPGARAVLGDRAGRHVQVDVVVLKKSSGSPSACERT